MPPPAHNSKGKGREGRSRHTTPVSTTSTDQGHVEPTASSSSGQTTLYDELLEQYCRGLNPPTSTTLSKIAEKLREASDVAKTRSDNCDKGMRELSKRRKELLEIIRQKELADKVAEEERAEKAKILKSKKEREDRPLAVGAHSLARQDGVDDEGTGVQDISPSAAPTQPEPAEAKMQPRQASPSLSDSSHGSQAAQLASAIPQYQTFGPDPSVFDDPTIYHLREVTSDMTEEEKKEILGVSHYPVDDLHDQTPGTPPDRDFSNAKPANQVTQNQFAAYLEPYVRPITEEDIAFLKERGDRTSPFVMPRRGQRSYKEIWAEEDGALFGDNEPSTSQQPSTNQPSGSMEQMNDQVAETNEVSAGPMMSRLLATLMPERRVPSVDVSASASINRDTSTDATADTEAVSGTNNGDDHASRPLPSATCMPESSQSGGKAQGSKMDYAEMDERLKQELRHIGFLSDDVEPDYDGHYDDEVAARLRYLQEQLREVSIRNGARKARVCELAQERLAAQEWSTIKDDLDTQLNQAYLKRHRNIGKGKKNMKRPGAATSLGGSSSGAGMSKPTVGEPIRALMERRNNWINHIGPVVDYGRMKIPEETIFDEESMARLEAKERELWDEAQEQT